MLTALIAIAFLVSLPIGALRAVARLVREDSRVRMVSAGPEEDGGAHVHVWRPQLRWRVQDPDTIEEIRVCGCGSWQPATV